MEVWTTKGFGKKKKKKTKKALFWHVLIFSYFFLDLIMWFNVGYFVILSGFCYLAFSSVQSLWCPTLCDPMNCSMPGFSVHHQLPKLTQSHVSDAIQPSHSLLSPSPAFNLSQNQGLLKWVSSSHQVVKVLEFNVMPAFVNITN